MEIIDLPIKSLKPYEKNPRRNDEAVAAVAESIKQFGFRVPCVIDRDNVLITGHTRLKAAKKLGLKTVPCIRATDLTEEQVRAFRLADNKVGELAEWDYDLLNEELDSLSLDMEDFGFEFELEDEEDEEKEPKERKDVEITSAWSLIIDCTSEEDMQEKYDTLAEMGIECRVSTL